MPGTPCSRQSARRRDEAAAQHPVAVDRTRRPGPARPAPARPAPPPRRPPSRTTGAGCGASRARSFTVQRSGRPARTQPVHLAQPQLARAGRRAGPTTTRRARRVQRQHRLPLRRRPAPPAPSRLRLADRVARDPVVPAEHACRPRSTISPGSAASGPQPRHQVGIAAARARSRCPGCPACPRPASPSRAASARTAALSGMSPSGKRVKRELRRAWSRTGTSSGRAPGRRRGAAPARPRPRPGARNARSPSPRRRDRAARPSRSVNLTRLVAAHAGHRRLAGRVAVGEILDHRLRGTAPRRRSRNAGCRAGRPRRARRGCPARRSRRPCGRSRRRGRRAAA